MRHAPGQVLVETALALPLLIGCSLGALQVVLYAHAHDVLVTAAQAGARLAAEDGRSLDEGYARTLEIANAGLGASANPIHMLAAADAELVEMRVDAVLHPVLPLPVGDGLPIHVLSRVARERFRPGGGVR